MDKIADAIKYSTDAYLNYKYVNLVVSFFIFAPIFFVLVYFIFQMIKDMKK